MLVISNLTKSFGGLVAVKEVSFEINKGEIFGLIGPNGAGKTTLFNLLTGFLEADSGTVKFKGEDITKYKPNKIVNKGLARTFQLAKPFLDMTVLENVTIPRLSPRVVAWEKKSSEGKKRTLEILEFVGLTSRKLDLVRNLPHGDIKRVEIARALATEPELLLLDEPFAGLNTTETKGLLSIINRLQEEGLTAIVIEHKLKELMKLVSRIIVLHHGAKIAEGSPEEIAKDNQVIEAYMGKGGMFTAT